MFQLEIQDNRHCRYHKKKKILNLNGTANLLKVGKKNQGDM